MQLPVHLRVSVGPAIPSSLGRLSLAAVFDCVAQAFASNPIALAPTSVAPALGYLQVVAAGVPRQSYCWRIR